MMAGSNGITDSYKTILSPNESEIKIRKSSFIANIFPVKDMNEINTNIKLIRKKYFDAKHHPYAFRLGLDNKIFRYNDDGEPSGSSGKPILDAIDKHCLLETLIIVTRYFGGVKLGIGGLMRAYFEAAENCISESKIIEKFITRTLNIIFKYQYVNLFMRLNEKHSAKIIENNSGATANYLIELRNSLIENYTIELSELTKGSSQIKITN